MNQITFPADAEGTQYFRTSYGKGGQYFKINPEKTKITIVSQYSFSPALETSKFDPIIIAATNAQPCTQLEFQAAFTTALDFILNQEVF